MRLERTGAETELPGQVRRGESQFRRRVSKFGGSSLAETRQAKKVLAIVQEDPERKIVVVSAPGKRNPTDRKITDLLYEWRDRLRGRQAVLKTRELIASRYRKLATGLSVPFDIDSALEVIQQKIMEGASADYAASRGEYLCAKILAEAIGYEFEDAEGLIVFDKHGNFSKKESYRRIARKIKDRRVVMPGFYGSMPDGSIKTFSRGGSDQTASIVASALGVTAYENWTDVDGVLTADPRIVSDARSNPKLSYKEARELGYYGASVFHEEAMFPVEEAGIPTYILNTNNPKHPGTRLDSNGNGIQETGSISGVTGKKGYVVIRVEKRLMNRKIGYDRKVKAAFETLGIPFEISPMRGDAITVVFHEQAVLDSAKTRLEGRGGRVNDAALHREADVIYKELSTNITRRARPDLVEYQPRIALVAVVGRGMAHVPGTAVRIFDALARANINVRVIDQESSELSIVVGVNEKDRDSAVRAIHAAFAEHGILPNQHVIDGSASQASSSSAR